MFDTIEAAPKHAFNKFRSLTRSNRLNRLEGSMKPTLAPREESCSEWQGHPEAYQEQAALALVEAGRELWPWSWVTMSCDGSLCLTTAHLNIHAPTRLAYPHGVCVYCGARAGTRDHLIPRTVTGDTHRRSVLTVPACGECNSMISDARVFSITERREYAHTRLRKKRAMVLRRFDYSDAELREFGPGLRPVIVQGLIEKRNVERRLEWPWDSAYDLRALGKSGIDDPYLLGLLKHEGADVTDVRSVCPPPLEGQRGAE